MAVTFDSLSPSAMSTVVGYLPLRDLLNVRGVSKSFTSQVDSIARPVSKGQVFIQMPDLTKCAVDQRHPRGTLRWTCGACRTNNNIASATCRRCGKVNAACENIRRVFFGQLRKDLTVECVQWMLAMLAPTVPVYHIENHTSKEGRGKGCAWIYITSAKAEEQLLKLNRRVFLDVDEQVREGMHVSGTRVADHLENYAMTRSGLRCRPHVLPRQQLVVERPAASAAESLRPTPPAPAARAPKSPNQAKERPSAAAAVKPQYPIALDVPTEKPTPMKPQMLKSSTFTSVRVPKVYRHDPYAFNPIPTLVS